MAHTHEDQQIIQESVAYLKEHGKTPEEYILQLSKTYDSILLAEDHRIKQNLLFAQNLIPLLYSAGVYNFGMEFGASEDQEALDQLVTSDYYDEDMARKLMFHYNAGWALQEYMDLYKKAWELNQTFPKDSKKFRIVNLSYQYDWTEFNGRKSSENYAKIFKKGDTESYRANLLEREIMNKNEKIVILTGTIHAFTKYNYPIFDFLSPNFCRYEERFMGNLLYKKYPQKVCTILLHQVFYNKNDREFKHIAPANGMIEHIMNEMDYLPIGFDLHGTPLGKLKDESDHSTGYPNFQLEQLADGYIFLKPFHQLEGCTIDYEFLKDHDWNDVHKRLDCDLSPRPNSIEEYWKQLEDYVDLSKTYHV